MNESHTQALVTLAIQTIESAQASRWKHHGFGLLSLYLTPAHRLNMWSRELCSIGPDDGAWHTHGAQIHSTVLAGSVWNTPLREAPDGEPREVWDASHGVVSRRGTIVRVVAGERREHRFASSYTTPHGEAHHTEAGERGGVTSVLILEPRDVAPVVWMKPGRTPRLAFADRCSDETIDRVRANSLALLREMSDAP